MENMINFTVDKNKCIGCGVCADACPSGAMITILSLRYGVDETFATRVNFVSTVLCAGTLPLMTHILL